MTYYKYIDYSTVITSLLSDCTVDTTVFDVIVTGTVHTCVLWCQVMREMKEADEVAGP